MDLLINIDVEDVARAESFYTTAFGLRPARRFGADGVELVGGSSRIYLLAKQAGSQATPRSDDARRYERHWTPVHLDFVVEDLDAALRSALAAGATLEKPVKDSSWGRLALMADPFGHGFCLIQFVGKGYDEIASA